MKSYTSLLVLMGLLALVSPLETGAQSVKNPSEPEAFREVFWGLSIRDAETGEELAGHNAHTLMTPASTMKLVSTGTALSSLGAAHRIKTQIFASGEIKGGTLFGNLYILGDGDFSIGSRYFWDQDPERFFNRVRSDLKNAGITRIQGDILSVSGAGDFQAVSPRWTAYDISNHYAAGCFSLNLFDNAYTVTLSRHGKSLSVKPEINGLKLKAAYGFSDSRSSDSLYISPFPDADGAYLITGVYPTKAATRTVRGAIPDPPAYFAQHLLECLTSGGIEVTGSSGKATGLPEGIPMALVTYESPTLFDLAKITNTYSHNLFAEGFLKLLGRGRMSLPGHNLTQTSLMALYDFWTQRGLDTRELEMLDGSGLSPENRVTPAFLTAMLGKIYREDPSHTFMQVLPRAGKDGTLTIFLKNTPLEGKARLKSGTIRNVVTYAGYVTLGGKTYTVALFVNNYYGTASSIRKGMERILLEAFSL